MNPLAKSHELPLQTTEDKLWLASMNFGYVLLYGAHINRMLALLLGDIFKQYQPQHDFRGITRSPHRENSGILHRQNTYSPQPEHSQIPPAGHQMDPPIYGSLRRQETYASRNQGRHGPLPTPPGQDQQDPHGQNTYMGMSGPPQIQTQLPDQKNGHSRPSVNYSPHPEVLQSRPPPGHQLEARDLQRQNSVSPHSYTRQTPPLRSQREPRELERSNTVSSHPDRGSPQDAYHRRENNTSQYPTDPRNGLDPSRQNSMDSSPYPQPPHNREGEMLYYDEHYDPRGHNSNQPNQTGYPEGNYEYPLHPPAYYHSQGQYSAQIEYVPQHEYPPSQEGYISQNGYQPHQQRGGYGYDGYEQNYPSEDPYYGYPRYDDYPHDPPYYNEQGYTQEGYPSQDYHIDPSQERSSPGYQYPIDSSLPKRQYSKADNSSTAKNGVEKPLYTMEAMEEHRTKAKNNGDPLSLFNFAKYLIEAAAEAGEDDPNSKNSKKIKDNLLQEAIKILKRLATQGMGFGKPAYPEAQFYLANVYGNGALGLQIDLEKAFNLYMQASKQNHSSATYRTAVCYDLGAGTKRDPHRATQFYRKAAALGDTAAMFKLGMILLDGLLSQNKNPREAFTWLKRAAQNADSANAHALHQLGLLHEKKDIQKEIPSIIHDEHFALEQFHKAADYGYPLSCLRLGCVYEYGQLGAQVNPQKSIYYYSKAAEKGEPEAEIALSGWYLTGSEPVLKQSDTEAYLWARKAADKGLAKAEYAIGYYSEVGIGVSQDAEEARRWYLRAAAQGNKRAQHRLTELKKLGNMKRVKPERHTRAQTKKEDCVIS
ncbi:hypothetical protein G9A89_015382 [Geosiphon pyriformis]|nr:hypothetical protein G9A89_015382 [Geosiphon pyriformis]